MSPINIGDFDDFWEDYDHFDGPVLIDEAKEPVKTGDIRPNWRLVIGGQDMTRRMISAEVTFNATGESGMTFSVASQLHKHGYERARTSLWIGYGNKLVPFFRGKLEKPIDSPSGLHSDATAYGLSTQLGARYFGHRVSFAGFTVREFFADIVARFGADEDRFFFDGEHDQIIESEDSEGGTAEFGLEHSYLEAIQTILPQMEFAAFDQTGGMMVVRKPPRADAVARVNLSGVLNDGHYSQGGFEFGESFANMYSKVVVFRRTEEYAGGGASEGEGVGMVQAEDGSYVPESFYGSDADSPDAVAGNRSKPPETEYAVYAEADVVNTGPFDVHEGRPYIIPDFPGQQDHAENTAQYWADAFSAGVGRYSLECAPIDFALYDFFGLERREERRTPEGHASFGRLNWTSRGDIYDILYACQVESMTLTIGPQVFRMRLEGPAAIKEETLVQAATDLTEIELSIPQDPTPPVALPEPGDLVGVVTDEGDTVVTDEGDTVVTEIG